MTIGIKSLTLGNVKKFTENLGNKMKKTLLVTLLTTGLASGFLTNAVADELPEAPAEVVKQAIEDCKEWAKEDDISAAELYKFVLNCVNDDLKDQEFKTVAKISL